MVPDDTVIVDSAEYEITSPAWALDAPAEQTVPLVFASPHSGAEYPASFIAASRLDAVALRRSEDAFVDDIFAIATEFGAPLLKATFPRAYVDPNREPFELDATMFDAPLPGYVNTASPRVAAGLGTIAKVVTSGEEIYRGKLRFDEVRRRIDSLYYPYHAALQRLLDRTRERFGVCLLIDCHSMPSIGGPMDSDPGLKRFDAVLGERPNQLEVTRDDVEVAASELLDVSVPDVTFQGVQLPNRVDTIDRIQLGVEVVRALVEAGL